MFADIATRLPLLAMDFGAPTPIIIAITLLVIGLLILRFVIKTAITIVKIGILVAIGVAAYMAIVWIMGKF